MLVCYVLRATQTVVLVSAKLPACHLHLYIVAITRGINHICNNRNMP